MNYPKLLVFVRHSESEGNIVDDEERTKLQISTCDYSLTDFGKKQAEIAGEYLRNRFKSFDAYYTSYYIRSKETMKIMFPNADIREDPCLAEVNRGIWHTMTEEQVKKYYPGEIRRKKIDRRYHYCPIGGESWADKETKIYSFFERLKQENSDKKVLVITHAIWMLICQRVIHNFSVEEIIEKYNNPDIFFENASIIIYEGVIKNSLPKLVLKEENIIPWKEKIRRQKNAHKKNS